MIENPEDFCLGQDDRQSFLALRPDSILEVVEIEVQAVAADKKQRIESLVLGGLSDPAFHRQVREKVSNMLPGHVLRGYLYKIMTKGPQPGKIGFFSRQGKMAKPHGLQGLLGDFLPVLFEGLGGMGCTAGCREGSVLEIEKKAHGIPGLFDLPILLTFAEFGKEIVEKLLRLTARIAMDKGMKPGHPMQVVGDLGRRDISGLHKKGLKVVFPRHERTNATVSRKGKSIDKDK